MLYTETGDYTEYRAAWKNNKTKAGDSPIHLDLELNSTCNSQCTFCPHSLGKERGFTLGVMRKDMIEKVLAEAKELGVYSVKYNHRGEPSLYPELLAFALLRSQWAVERAINTNINAFDEYSIEQVIDAGLNRCIIAVDGMSKEVYEKVRVKLSFEKQRENIEHFIRINEKYEHSCFVSLRWVNNTINMHELEQFNAWAGQMKSDKLIDEIFVKDVAKRTPDGSGYMKKERVVGRNPCPYPNLRLLVDYDGKVAPCCADWSNGLTVGDVNTMTLKQIWESSKMKTLRKVLGENDYLHAPKTCQNCLVRETYKYKSEE